MRKLKKLAPWGLLLLLILLAFEVRHLPRRLEGVLDDVQGDDFWNLVTVCTVEDEGYYEMSLETELTLGEALEGVWVRGPYPTKTTTVAGGSLDVYALLPDPAHPEGGPQVHLDVFWEKTDTQGGMRYSFNIDAREWVVVWGGEKVEAFIKELHDLRYEQMYP